MTIGNPLLLKNLLPGFLRVIQDKGHELDFRCCCWSSSGIREEKQVVGTPPPPSGRKEIQVETRLRNKKDEQSAQADVKSAKAAPTKASEPATTIIAAVFHVTAVATRRPTHCNPPEVLDADIKTIVRDRMDSFQ